MDKERCYCKEPGLMSENIAFNHSMVDVPVTIVIFGATGDLTRRKLVPAFFNLYKDRFLSDKFNITGVARRYKSDEDFASEMKEMIFEDGEFNAELWEHYSKKLSYYQGNFNEISTYEGLNKYLFDSYNNTNILYYLACEPEHFISIIENLSSCGLLEEKDNFWRRVVIEKPFGRDLESARELNKKISCHLKEEQIYRIDHYLGKETVQNILSFRFGNAIFEPIFNSKYIDHIQITVAETLGMEGRRGAYYDKSGAIRDIVQNHLLQLFALVAMEPPALFQSKAIQDEKVKLFKSVRPLTECCIKKKVVRGQYSSGIMNGENVKAYKEEIGVLHDSTTESYVAMELNVDNWRWAGVPFYLRTGKRLKSRITEIAVQFKIPPLRFFNTVECEGDVCDIIRTEPNVIAFQVQPDEGISLTFSAKRPGHQFLIQPVTMDFGYKETFHKRLAEAYERLLLDVIKGDKTLFPRFDEIEATWEIVDPIIKYWEKSNVSSIPLYSPGSDGPKESCELFCNCEGRWRNL